MDCAEAVHSHFVYKYLWQAKEDAGDLIKVKADLQDQKRKLEESVVDKEEALQRKLKTIGNYVHDSVPVSDSEVCTPTQPAL